MNGQRWPFFRREHCPRARRHVSRRIELLERRQMLAGDVFEPNEAFGTAFELVTGDLTVPGLSLHETGDADWYRWTAPASGNLNIDVLFQHAAGDIDMVLRAASGEALASSTGAADNEHIVVLAEAGATYYPHVFGYLGATNPSYTLKIDGPGQIPSDPFEPNETLGQAFDLGIGDQAYAGLSVHREPGQEFQSSDDWYRWTALAGGTLRVDIDFIHALGDLDLKLYNAGGAEVASSASAGNHELVVADAAAGESFYIRVFGYTGATNPRYALAIDGQEILPDGFEPNDSVFEPFDLGSGDQSHGGLSIHFPGNDDYYRWTATVGGPLSVDVLFHHAQGDLDLELLNANGQYLAQSNSTDDNEHLDWQVSAGTTYLFRVFGYNGAVNPEYDLSINGPEVFPDRFEPNDSFDTATRLGEGNLLENDLSIHAPGNDDYYLWTSPALGTATIELLFSHAAGDVDVYWYDRTRTLIASATGVVDNERLDVFVEDGAAYFLRVIGAGGAINPDYDLRLSVFSQFAVDATVVPEVPSLPGIGGGPERPVAAIENATGEQEDFVLNEVIVYAPEPQVIDDFVARYNGQILAGTLPIPIPGPGVEVRPEFADWDTYLVRVDLSRANAARLSPNVETLGLDGELRYSDEDALRLTAILAEAAVETGLDVAPVTLVDLHSPNFVISSTLEQPQGGGFINGFGYQWVNDGDLGVTRAWQYFDLLNRPRNVRLAVIDQGFSLNADYPAAANVPQYDLVDDDNVATGTLDVNGGWHGTGSSSVAGARLDNQFGGVGTGGQVAAPMLFRVDPSIFTAARAVRTAAYWGAEVVNMSLGAECGFWCRTFGIFSGYSAINNAISDAAAARMVVMASAGNEEWNLDGATVVPCESPQAICVGAIDPVTKQAIRTTTHGWGSSYGANVDIWAPGTGLTATPNPASGGNLTSYGGTSGASPYVAGVVALMKAIDPGLSVAQVKNYLQQTANSSTDARVSTGYINAFAAVKAVADAAGVFPQGDQYEPNNTDATARTISPGNTDATITPGDVDYYAFQLADYSNVQLRVRFLDTFTPLNGLNANLDEVDGTAVGGVITLDQNGLAPGRHVIELFGQRSFTMNAYRIELSTTPATIAPDRFDDMSHGPRNDTLASAAVIPDEVLANNLLTTVGIDELNFDTSADIDFFTIQLEAAIDPITGQSECLPPGDPRLDDAATTQGRFTLTVYPDVVRPFTITLYKDGAPFNVFTEKSGLSYSLNCPHQYFPDGRITFSIDDPAGRNYYDVGLAYNRWNTLLDVPPWFLEVDPPLFRRDVKSFIEDHELLFPMDPRVVNEVFGGQIGDPLPPEYLTFRWEQPRDYALDVILPEGGDLQVKLINSNQEVVAEALPITRARSTSKRLEAPDLPPGLYFLEVSGAAFGTPYVLDTPNVLPGDTNDDLVVDIHDLNAVRNHFGEGTLGGPRIPGDAYPFDGIVNINDLNAVRNHFGESLGTPSLSANFANDRSGGHSSERSASAADVLFHLFAEDQLFSPRSRVRSAARYR